MRASANSSPPSVLARLGADGLLWAWDAACAACDTCVAGLPALCEAPVAAVELDPDSPHERWKSRPVPEDLIGDPAVLCRSAAALDRLVAAGMPAAAVVLVGGELDGAETVARVLEASGARAVVAVPADAAVRPGAMDADRATSAFRGAGGAQRADVAIALDGDLALAARLVRRGGAVAALDPPRRSPAVTTLVQRELDVIGPRDVLGALLMANLSDRPRRGLARDARPAMNHEKEAEGGA